MTEQFSKSEAIEFGWNTMKKNFWFWVLILLTIGIISSALQAPGPYADKHDYQGLAVLTGLLAYLVQLVFQMGQARIVLKFCDKNQPDYVDLFTTWRPLLKVFLAGLLYGLIIMAGLILFIIPGIIWAIRFQFYLYHIVDRDSGPIEALQQSFALTKGHTWNLFLLALLMFGINILGFLALLIGLFATIPATTMAHGYVYRWLFPASSQSTPINQGPIIWEQ